MFHFLRLAIAAFTVLAGVAGATACSAASDRSALVGTYKIAINPKVSMQEAAESLRIRANTWNLKLVAELPLSKQVEAMTGKAQKTITIFQFCDALTAKKLIDLNLDFSVYMPCRIALIEDAQGQGWLVMMDVNTDAIAREKALPEDLRQKVEQVRTALIDMMKAGATGEL